MNLFNTKTLCLMALLSAALISATPHKLAIADRLLESYACEASRGANYAEDRRILLNIAIKQRANPKYQPTEKEQIYLKINDGHRLHNECIALLASIQRWSVPIQPISKSTPLNNQNVPQDNEKSTQYVVIPANRNGGDGMSEWCG